MKKFIAALIAVVMVVSCMSVAFAAEVDCYDMASYKSGARAGVAIKGVEAGQKITFYVKPVAGEVIEGYDMLKMYVRNVSSSAKATYVESGKEVYGVWFDNETDGATWGNEDGWFYIECITPDAGDFYLSVVTYDPDGEAAENGVEGATVGACQIAGIAVDGTPVEAVYAFGDSGVGDALTATSIEAPVADAVVDGGEDETEDVEDTGVVSVAVVAVAAVVGGAVVLKKREF